MLANLPGGLLVKDSKGKSALLVGDEPVITTGQIYADRDKRMQGRHVKVMHVDHLNAYCSSCHKDGSFVGGKLNRISLKTLRTRWRLVEPDSEDV